jgi:hypothetical protein
MWEFGKSELVRTIAELAFPQLLHSAILAFQPDSDALSTKNTLTAANIID